MKKFLNYIRSAIRNILSNKLYSTFYILGTAVAFILIILLLSAVRLVGRQARPFVNAANTIHISPDFESSDGDTYGIATQDIERFVKAIPGTGKYCISNSEGTMAFVNGKVRPANVDFVDSRYFEVNDFNFTSGRPFTEDGLPQAVILKSFAEKVYRTDPVGERINIQKTDYRIVGVVDDFSPLQNPNERAVIWLPYKFNKFVPSGGSYYEIDIVFDSDMPAGEMKENLGHALTGYLTRNIPGGENTRISPSVLRTVQENKYDFAGGSAFGYGAVMILLLLILIPALNIMSLSSARIQASGTEIAIRRALGATRNQALLQMLSENIILSLAGFVIAAFLAGPCLSGIDRMLFSGSNSISVLTGFRFDFVAYAAALVLALLAALISGGIPAYNISRKNIANELKGRDL